MEQKEELMKRPDHETMEVLVVVAFPELNTRASEKAWEQDILDAVSAAVYADKTLDVLAVRPLEYEDCEWIFEGGTPMPDYGVTVGQDGAWHSGTELYRTKYEASGKDLQSLFEYLIAKGLIKK